MEQRAVMAVQIDHRSTHAPEVQEILTRFGCLIEARLGLNRGCEDRGLILLELSGDSSDIAQLSQSLSGVESVSVKTMVLD